MDEYLDGGRFIKHEMERVAKEVTEKKELDRKDKLIAQTRVLRMLSVDDVLMSVREEAKMLKNEALLKILDPSKRKPSDTLETLAVEARCHDMYCSLFDKLELQGKQAAQTLQKEAKTED
jgi:hypothetical protein